MGLVKHSQSSQNSKFGMSLQCLEKEVRDEIDFLHSPTSWFQHFGSQSFVQGDTDGHAQAFSSHLK